MNAAIVNNEGIIENVLIFDDEETMKEFGAVRLADGQGIGDKYMTPEEAEKIKQISQFTNLINEEINKI